jgi:hypothetical protein
MFPAHGMPVGRFPGKTLISFVMVIDWDYGSDEVNMKTRRM